MYVVLLYNIKPIFYAIFSSFFAETINKIKKNAVGCNVGQPTVRAIYIYKRQLFENRYLQ